jgi:NAD+ kinase
MFSSILIVCKSCINGESAPLRVVEKVKEILKDKKVSLIKLSELKKSDISNKDLIITIGGDGTFLKVSHFLNEQPILGINSEPEKSEGALTSMKESEIDKLKEILQGRFRTIQRQRAAVKINNTLIDEHALNDVYAGASNQFHTSRYVINFKGNKEEQRSSGVLIVTGSGSTAWYKSAHGKPFSHDEKKLKFKIREPYFGNLFKPKILDGELAEGEKMLLESRRHEGGVIAIDSNKTYQFNFGDTAEIELSKCHLNTIAPV